MKIILNERQRKIFNDLCNTPKPIAGKILADKYNISIRTFRNDIDVISEYVKENDATFVRIPKVGMRITNISTISNDNDDFLISNYIYLSKDEKKLVIFLFLLLNKNPITINQMCDKFIISKGTLLSDIDKLNKFFKDNKIDCSLLGIKNKGYYLNLMHKSLIKTLTVFIELLSTRRIKRLLDFNSDFINDNVKDLKNQFKRIIKEKYSITIIHGNSFDIFIYVLIRRLKISNSVANKKYIKQNSQLDDILNDFCNITNAKLSKELKEYLSFVLDEYTDYDGLSNSLKDKDNLDKAINKMLDEMMMLNPQLSESYNLLKDEITLHLISNINRKKIGQDNKNPLLNQIKARFPDVFSNAKNAAKIFNKEYNYYLDDDEISYLTLYYAKSLEEKTNPRESKIMLVCNTGRGASRLLATRIMNNLPEAHIVGMFSSNEPLKESDAYKDADLIISTFMLEDINKPCLVVSPLLSEEELFRIKKAIHINSSSLSEGSDTTYTLKDDDENSLMYSEIAIEVIDMCSKLLKDKPGSDTFAVTAGIMSHTMMSITRWKRLEFIKAQDYDVLIKKYKKEYKIIEEFIKKMEQKLNITIDRIEIVAILRYLVS